MNVVIPVLSFLGVSSILVCFACCYVSGRVEREIEAEELRKYLESAIIK